MKWRCLAVLFVIFNALPASGASGDSCRQLSPPGLQPGGQFGCSVDLHAGSQTEALAVGANLGGTGSVTLCLRAFEDWECEPPLAPADGQSGDEFGRSVAVDDDWLAVGAPFANGSGVVYLYRRDGGVLTLRQKLSASDGARGDQLGLTLALSGDTLIVGAPNNVGRTGSLSGAVYVFHLDGETWTQGQKLTAGDAAPFDNFGFSLAIDGATAVVGAPFHDGVAGNSGAAYVFERDGEVWNQRARLTASDGAADDEFGSAVAVSGNALAVGARTDDVNGLKDAGSAYVYERRDSGWSAVAHFFGQAAGDRFGVAVSMSGDQLVVGALLHNGSGPESGAAYPFLRHRNPDGTFQWLQNGDPLLGTAAGDRFGQAVSTDGSEVLVGAYRAEGGTGAAKVCPLATPTVDLGLFKSGPASAKPGQTIAYTLTVTNHGPDEATGVLLEEMIPAGLQPVAASLPAGCAIADGRITCALPDLASQQGQEVRLEFKALETCATTIVNQATVAANEESPVRSNQVSTALVRTADLAVVSTGPPFVKPGGPFVYNVEVLNLGPDIACGVVVRDSIPSGALAPWIPAGCTAVAGEIQCPIRELPAGASRIFAAGFQAPQTAAPASRLVNTATVSATPASADPRPLNDSATNVIKIAARIVQIPALSGPALMVLALLLTVAALRRLRRRTL